MDSNLQVGNEDDPKIRSHAVNVPTVVNYPVALGSQCFPGIINVFIIKSKTTEYLWEELVDDRNLEQCLITVGTAKFCTLLWLA